MLYYSSLFPSMLWIETGLNNAAAEFLNTIDSLGLYFLHLPRYTRFLKYTFASIMQLRSDIKLAS